MTIRPLTELDELQACVELQRRTWGLADIEVIPTRMLLTQIRIGGLILGAFEDGKLVGFLNATPGIRGETPYWYSQMLAVDAAYRNHGIGVSLKLTQRDHARELGIHLIEWTFDPLEAKNAYVNIVKLGVIARRYYVNLYGATVSDMQRGLQSDRLIAEWWIDQPRVTIAGDVRRILVPSDIQALKRDNPKSAQETQLRVRETFLQNFKDDYYAAGFERTGDGGEYLFIRGASGVHS
jgi:predicted GNAT superfamily acetyltransferase